MRLSAERFLVIELVFRAKNRERNETEMFGGNIDKVLNEETLPQWK